METGESYLDCALRELDEVVRGFRSGDIGLGVEGGQYDAYIGFLKRAFGN